MSDLLSHFDTQIQNQEQQLREREQELEQLRRQRDRLAELTRQRDELHAQLRAVEGDIALVERTMTSALDRFGGRFGSAPPVPPPVPAPSGVTPAAPRRTEPPAAPAEPKTSSLKDEIRRVLRTARGPMTGPDIAASILAGGYKTTSRDFPNIVKKQLSEMDDVTHTRGQGYKLKK